jgi:hypothetical protein
VTNIKNGQTFDKTVTGHNKRDAYKWLPYYGTLKLEVTTIEKKVWTERYKRSADMGEGDVKNGKKKSTDVLYGRFITEIYLKSLSDICTTLADWLHWHPACE